MQRITTQLDNPVNEEWTKYFVNGLECKRDAIYETIIDNIFYTGKINLSKKYHFKHHEAKMVYDSYTFHRETFENDESKNRSASFSLNTGEFVKKTNPTSDEYKLLVNRMIHVLDTFDEAQQNHSEHSTNLRIAIVNCMEPFFEKITDFEAPYNNIMHKFSLEYFAFLFDMITFGLSRGKESSGKIKIPGMEFDISSIKESWDEYWTNSKKSQFIDKYFSVMLKQANVIGKLWMKNDLFADKSTKNEIQSKFDEFKKFVKSLQTQKALLDASMLDVSFTSKIASFFHLGEHAAPKELKPIHVQKSALNMK